MKRKISILLLVMALLLLVMPAHAQVSGFGSPQVITGNAISTPVDTNAPPVLIRKITLTISSANLITNFTGNVYLSLNPTNIAGTNALLVGTFIITNTTSFGTNFQAYYTNPPIYTVLQAQTGTNVVSTQLIYGP